MPVQIDPELCDACLHCADVCPNNCIENANNGTKNHAQVKPDECIDCHLCVAECEKGAITPG